MQVLTTTGEFAQIEARSWPLAGLDQPASYTQSWGTINLSSLSSGELRYASYRTIYRSNPWVYAAVQLKARNLARLPLHVFVLDAEGNRNRVRGDLPGSAGRPSALQELDSLLQNPSPGIGRNRMLRATLTDKYVYGNALWVKERLPSGKPVRLWRAPWRDVIVNTGETVPIMSYEVRGSRGQEGRIFDPSDVVHFASGDDPDAPIGLSPLEPLKYTVALIDAMQRHLSAYFQNRARLSGHLKIAPGTSKKDLDHIREVTTQLYTSPENAGKPLVTSGDWQQMGAPPGDSEIIDLIRLSREEILAALHIPPPVAGILDQAIKSNVVQLREQFGRDVLGPDAEELEEEIRAQLIEPSPQWNYAFAEFEFGELLRPDLATQAETMQRLEHTLSPDERRALYNYPPIGTPDAKVPTTPMQERPLGYSVDVYGAPRQPGEEPLPAPSLVPSPNGSGGTGANDDVYEEEGGD